MHPSSWALHTRTAAPQHQSTSETSRLEEDWACRCRTLDVDASLLSVCTRTTVRDDVEAHRYHNRDHSDTRRVRTADGVRGTLRGGQTNELNDVDGHSEGMDGLTQSPARLSMHNHFWRCAGRLRVAQFGIAGRTRECNGPLARAGWKAARDVQSISRRVLWAST